MMFQYIFLLFPLVISAAPDWLVEGIKTPTTLSEKDGILELSNGLISRYFTTTPDFTTIDYVTHSKRMSLFRKINPEVDLSLDFSNYKIGSLNTNMDSAYFNRTDYINHLHKDPKAFHYINHTTHIPDAPFYYQPKRFAPQNINWPPKGLRLDVMFGAPPTAPIRHQGVTVIVHYEMYDCIPLMAKWISVFSTDPAVEIEVHSIETLSVNKQWSPEFNGWLFVENSYPHAVDIIWNDDSTVSGLNQPTMKSVFYPPFSIPISKNGFVSHYVFELVTDTSDRERAALSRHRMMRILAPQTQENPIFFHTMKPEKEDVIKVLDQMADIGFEMLFYSFGSRFNFESDDPAYIEEIRSIIAYANSKGIEVGGYDLIVWGRHNVAKEWLSINPDTATPNREACLASGWYEHLVGRLTNFINQTGLSTVETDGPYGGHPCASGNHSHHRGLPDSVYQNTKLQAEMYKLLRTKNIYINQPDRYFYQGGNKEGKSPN